MKTVDKNENDPKGKISTGYLVLTALFTAMTAVVTIFLNIPAAFILGAGGNINLGDVIIFIASVVLGPFGGAITGALGSCIADLSGAYFIYAPFTFVIKGLEGFLCGFCFRYAFKKHKAVLRRLISMAIAGAAVVIGYFFTEIILMAVMEIESFTALFIAGVKTIPGNLLQVGLSAVIAITALSRIPEFYLRQGGGL